MTSDAAAARATATAPGSGTGIVGDAPPADPDVFRAEVRAFFDGLPARLADAGTGIDRARAYRRALVDAGLAGIEYPVGYGGRGLDRSYAALFDAESRGRVPPEHSIFAIGIGMALPVVRDHATDELKRRFLPPGLAGEEIWCQLYSEPGAGSDLASLATRARLDGDEWVVDGQKVWTSGAQHSQLAILLARTSPEAPKHRGITMFVLPMEQPGVTVRPLRQMTGEAEFNEVFLDGARIPRDWVVGDVDDGWRMAVALLAHERVQTGVASMSNDTDERMWARVPIPVGQLVASARRNDRLRDPAVRQELAQLWINERIVRLLATRDVHPSIGKLWRTRQGRAATAFASRVEFPAGIAWEEDDEDARFVVFQTLNCRGMSLGGGTDEIQRNTLGERVLGLPREPAVDRDVPFRDLPTGRGS